MKPIKINPVDTSLEILVKIANATAKKFGLKLKMNREKTGVEFTGTRQEYVYIIQEMINMFQDSETLIKNGGYYEKEEEQPRDEAPYKAKKSKWKRRSGKHCYYP